MITAAPAAKLKMRNRHARYRPGIQAKPCQRETRAKGKLAAFDWADPLKFEDLLTEDERAIRDTAHAYCQEKLQPRC